MCGSPLYQPFSRPGGPIQLRVSFLTYNIHKGIGNDRLFRLERILETLREADADIIALQEVD